MKKLILWLIASVCSLLGFGQDIYLTEALTLEAMDQMRDRIDGRSFLPMLSGNRMDVDNRQFVWHFPHNYDMEPYSVIRLGNWKLIYWYKDGKKELYNIPKDISESHDLIKENPDIAKDLSSRLGSYLRQVKAGRPTYTT